MGVVHFSFQPQGELYLSTTMGGQGGPTAVKDFPTLIWRWETVGKQHADRKLYIRQFFLIWNKYKQ